MAKICEQTAHRTVWDTSHRRIYSNYGEESSFGYNDWDIYHGA